MAKILIVDDEEMDRILLSEILHQAGHEPLFAPNGQVALNIWKRAKVDLVVTDIVMPELNGLELFEKMREEDPWVRVIAISGVTAKKLNEAASSGALAILTKPVDPEELLTEIEKALENSGSWMEVE
ncbi:MAG: response regulator [Gemmatimonadota bacterium]|jgi:CheY-like chemotaxis protein